jgi:hypothetical protein
MSLMTMRLALASAILGVCVSAPEATATTLLPGGDVVPALLATDPNDAATLSDTGFKPFDVTQSGVEMVGFWRAAVITGYASNPFGSSALTFIYQVGLTSSSPDGEMIEHLIMSNFGSVATDVGFFQADGLLNPADVSRTAGSGDAVSFNFVPGGIALGDETSILIINTDATKYTQGTLTIEGGVTVTLNAFGATSLIPEPAAIVGATTSLALVGGAGLRRRSKSSRAA